jgi:hypothetical protein
MFASLAINRRLKAIVRSMARREDLGEDGFAAHEKWAMSDEGGSEIRFLAEHFTKLDSELRAKSAVIAARTGMASAVPLVLAGLNDSESGTSVAQAVRYATFFGSDPAFRSAVASAMVKWLPRKPYPESDNVYLAALPKEHAVIEALPKLDAALATRVLATPKWLNPEAPFAFAVFKAFNSINLPLPLELILRWLDHWEKPALGRRYDSSAVRAYSEGLFALVLHHPARAIEEAERLIARRRAGAEISEIYLSAHGLRNLYHRLVNYFDDPATFDALPLPARVFFTVSAFAALSDNGGVGLPLGSSIGNYFQLVLEGCRLIGDAAAVGFLSGVRDLFGPPGPSANQDKRNLQMDRMQPDFESRVEAISVGKWSWDVARVHLNRYAARHAETLKGITAKRAV